MWCIYLWQRFILRTLVRRGQAWKIIIISIVFVWMTIRFAISSLLLYCWFYYFGWCWTIFDFLLLLVDWYFGWLRRDVSQSNRDSWNLILIFIRVRIVNLWFFFLWILTLLIEFLCLILKTFRQIKGYTYVGNK